MSKRLSFALIVGTLCGSALFGGGLARAEVPQGVKAFERQDYRTAFAEFEPPALQGDAEAALYLARMYERGYGVDKSPPLAARWYTAAAQKGNPDAQYALARFYERGLGLPLSPKDALSWYRKAVDQNHTDAMIGAAEMFLAGRGVKPDLLEAQKLLAKAAELGNAKAAIRINMLVAQGRMSRPTIPGDPDPEDPVARKILADVTTVLRPYMTGNMGSRLTLDDRPRIAVSGRNRFDVYLPGVVMTGSDGSTTRLGTVNLNMAPAVRGRYEGLKILLPGAVAMSAPNEPQMFLRLGRQNVSMTWDMALGTAVQLAAVYDDVSVAPSVGEPMATLSQVNVDIATEEPKPGILTGAETVTVKGLKMGPQGMGLRVDGVTLKSAFGEFDTVGYMRLLKEIGIDWAKGEAGTGVAGLSSRLGEMIALIQSFSTDVTIEGVEVTGPDGQLGRLGRGGFGFDGQGFGGDMAQMRFRFGFDGLMAGTATTPSAAPDAPPSETPDAPPESDIPAPDRFDLAVLVKNIPVKALAAEMDKMLSQAMVAAMNTPPNPDGTIPLPPDVMLDGVNTLMLTSGLALEIEKGELAGPGYDMTLKGMLHAEVVNGESVPVGDLVVEAHGLAQLSAKLETLVAEQMAQPPSPDAPFNPMLLTAMQGVVVVLGREEAQVEADGRPVHRFTIRFAPKEVTVNGKPIDAFMVPPESAPDTALPMKE